MSQQIQYSQEYALLDFANRVQRNREGRIAIYFHLSQLKPQNRREHHIRIASNTLEEASSNFEGQVFMLGNHDCIIALREVLPEHIDEVIMRMRTLFNNDPLAMSESSGAGTRNRFVDIINIDAQYDNFLKLCEQSVKNEEARQKRLMEISHYSNAKGDRLHRPLTTAQLSKMEETLKMADLSNLFRRQAICKVTPEQNPQPLFMELFISIQALAEAMVPDVQLASNRWLFMHLTQTLDIRMIKLLMRGEDSTLKRAFSVNLNVTSVLRQDFLNFDATLKDEDRRSMIIELQFVDIVASYDSYIFAREFLKDKGYRICVDGVTTDHMPLIDRGYLGADLVKITSDQHFLEDGNQAIQQSLFDKIKTIGPKRVILARCDNEQVINIGQQMGIVMFQGHYIDQQIVKLNQKSSRNQ